MPLGPLIGGFMEGVAEGEERRRDQEYNRFRMQMEQERLEFQRMVEQRQLAQMEENERMARLQEERLARKERFEEFYEPFSRLPPDVAARATPQLEEARSLFMEQELRPGAAPMEPAPTIGPPERTDFASRRQRIATEIGGIGPMMETEAEARKEREAQRDFERAKQLKRLDASLRPDKPQKPVSTAIMAEVNAHDNMDRLLGDLEREVSENRATGLTAPILASRIARAIGIADENVVRLAQAQKLTELEVVLKYARTTFSQGFVEGIRGIVMNMTDQPEIALVGIRSMRANNKKDFLSKLKNWRAGNHPVDDIIIQNFGAEGLADAMKGTLDKASPDAIPRVKYQDPVTGKITPQGIPMNRMDLIRAAEKRGWVKVD